MVRFVFSPLIFFPVAFNPVYEVKITRTDGTVDNLKKELIYGKFIRQATIGTGSFKLVLNNTGNKHLNKWTGGNAVEFLADITDGTTTRFKGNIDFIKENLTEKGQILEIEGRHISTDLTEIHISRTFTNQDGSTVLKSIISDFLPGLGFTTTNVTDPIGTVVTINWSNKPFWECVFDLCLLSNADCFVDDDKDFHFFKQDTIENSTDVIVEGYNLRDLKGFGTDKYFARTKVTVFGEDENGLPIIFTSGSGTKEKIITDKNIKTVQEAEDRANKELSDLSASNLSEQATTVSYGLRSLEPGEKIWISSPREKVHNTFRVIEIKHEVGLKVGYWRTICKVEKEETDTMQILRENKRKELRLDKVGNPNGMNFSYNFTFDNTENTDTLTNVTIDNGKLILSTGATSGIMTSVRKVTGSNITSVELRFSGTNLDNSTFEASADNGTNFVTLTRNTVTTITNTGKNLVLRITLRTSGDTRPDLDSVALLFKT